MQLFWIFVCIVLWGTSAFLNRLSVDKTSPFLLQTIIGIMYVCYIPISLRLANVGNPFTYKWSWYSVILTSLAGSCSIIANVILYSNVKDNINSGSYISLVCLYPIITLLWSLILLGESLTWSKLIGAIVMIIGAIFMTLK